MRKMPVLLPVLGGIKVLLMLFARVVEMNASEDIQVTVQILSEKTDFQCFNVAFISRSITF